MPRYTVDEVLAIIKTLTPEEKRQLKLQLPTVLELVEGVDAIATSPGITQQQTRSMSVGGDFKVSGSGVTVDLSQEQQAFGGQSMPQTASISQEVQIQELLSELEHLKVAIAHNPSLNPIQKDTAAIPLKVMEQELQKTKPDKTLVEQAIATLQKGLEGVQTLAEPTMKVAALVAKAWAIL